METALLIISILLIAIVLLQSNKASDASQIITGGNSELFSNQKERGAELLISRITFVLGMAFFILSFVIIIKGTLFDRYSFIIAKFMIYL